MVRRTPRSADFSPPVDPGLQSGKRLDRLWSSLPVRILLASILAVAAYTKLKDPAEIIATVGRAGLTPSPWDKPIAYAIIGTEILLALLLLPRPTAKLGAAGYAGLSSIFFGYSLWRGWQDIKAPCGCFGLLLRLEPWHGALFDPHVPRRAPRATEPHDAPSRPRDPDSDWRIDMNAPLLILPALAATMALSAAKTLPPDLRQDAKGKAPLTVAKMAAARGAGSACRNGCSEPNRTCVPQFGPDPGTGDPGPVMGYFSQVWSPHKECGPAIFGTCVNKGDVLCNTVYQYGPGGCNGSVTPIITKTSSCDLPVANPEG